MQAPDWAPAPPVEGALLGAAGVEEDTGDGGVEPESEPPVGEGVDGATEVGEASPEPVGAGAGVALGSTTTLVGSAPDDGSGDWAGDGAMVAKTPPGRTDVAGFVTAEVAGGLAGGLAGLPEPEPEPPEPVLPPFPLTAAQVPTMVSADDPVLPVTSGPGSGKMVSTPSLVLHPLSRLATKMLGRDEKAASARLVFFTILEFAPPMVTDAQLI